MKLLAKKRKRMGNPNRGNENIQSRHKDGIWLIEKRHVNYGK